MTDKTIAQKMLGEFGKDIKDISYKILNGTKTGINYAFKYGLVYPIAGNLSIKTKSFLEEQFGEEKFNEEIASPISILSNTIVDIGIGSYLGVHYFNDVTNASHSAAFNGICGALIFGIAGFCVEFSTRVPDGNNKIRASLVGKIASLPMDYGIDLYKRATKPEEK